MANDQEFRQDLWSGEEVKRAVKKFVKGLIKPFPRYGQTLNTIVLTGFVLLVFSAVALAVYSKQPKTIQLNTVSNYVSQSVHKSAPSTTATTITTSALVTLLNQQRAAKGLAPFKWITQLNAAAVARANYMVANNTTSNTVGDPGADITDANYAYSNAEWNDTWNQTTIQGVITAFTTGNASDFGFTSAYSDIGVAIVPDTVGVNHTQLIFIYLANQSSSAPRVDTYTPPATYTYVPPPMYTYTPAPSATTGCNESAKATYTSNYYSQVDSENARYNTEAGQISYAIAQINIDGAADSSAMVEVQAEQARNVQQHQYTLENLESTYQQELSEIDCSN